MRGVIFVNGRVDEPESLRRWLREDDFLVAADGGSRHLDALGLLPHALVGDLDSIPRALLAAYQAAGVEVERHPVRKDATDLELAVDRAVQAGVEEVLLLGALGGRLDQTVANLLLLARVDWPVPISLAEGEQVAQIVRDGQTLELAGAIGATVSAIPLSEEVTGVTYTGLEYPLENATLRLGSTRGVSNVLVASPATVAVESGMLLVAAEAQVKLRARP